MNNSSEVGSEGGAELSRVGVLRGSPWASKNEVRVSSFSLWMLNDFFSRPIAILTILEVYVLILGQFTGQIGSI